ncbi:unnamed protein product [Linum trigynum]|uniref:F-box domain-containing protein n=1 Tax=Linum trigynum TaxID=586398 RepID=A0AAV2FCU6_9ROSI
MGTSVVEAADQFAKLPEELAVEILSRSAITLNEAVRCSSLLGKRWRYMWQLIDSPVLDFDKSDDDVTPESQRRFVDRVDQAISWVQQSRTRLDGLKIGFKLYHMQEAGWRWIEFGFAERVKRLTLLSYFTHSWRDDLNGGIPVPLFTPDFLRTQNLSRLEVLEFQRLAAIPQGTLEHIFYYCPSLQRFSLTDCTFHGDDTVVRVYCPNNNNLQKLTFWFPIPDHGCRSIDLFSAPGLHSLEVRTVSAEPAVLFPGDLPQLQELQLCYYGIGHTHQCFIPWSPTEFKLFAPRLQFLKYNMTTYQLPNQPLHVPEWLLFEKLTVLDLSIHICTPVKFMLQCTILLRAAPMLRRLSMTFENMMTLRGRIWEDRAEEEFPTWWKHRSLQVLQLHGVHPSDEGCPPDPRKLQMGVAACIIMASPLLNEVLVDTRNLKTNASREQQRVDALISEARIELETRLECHASTSQIRFIYQ